jgi:hypothetical protein
MSIDITERQSEPQLTITYTNDSGESASVTVVGMTKEEAEERREEIIETHNLREKAREGRLG